MSSVDCAISLACDVTWIQRGKQHARSSFSCLMSLGFNEVSSIARAVSVSRRQVDLVKKQHHTYSFNCVTSMRFNEVCSTTGTVSVE